VTGEAGLAGGQDAAARLARLSDEYFEVVHTTDPFTATQLGVSGFDALVPDPSRDGAARGAQRIAAARGFYRSAPLLIMDEPTAALDARAEYALFSSIRGHARARSVLLITHRLASVRHADRIYVLREGRVIEQGGHADLLALGGQYAELFNLQASQYEL